jgi:hypothetical protein
VIQKCQKYIKIRATCASKSSEIPRYTCTMDGKPGQLRAIVVGFMVLNDTFLKGRHDRMVVGFITT